MPVDYGIYAGQLMTIELEQLTGAGFGRAIYHHYVEPIVSAESRTHQPNKFQLSQNFPNPFNPTTTIEFFLPQFTYVNLSIFNTLGQQVAVLSADEFPPGKHSIDWNAGNQSSGVYFYRLTADDKVLIKKLTLVK